jgi:hypothetical protein
MPQLPKGKLKMNYFTHPDFSILLGKTFTSVVKNEDRQALYFTTTNDERFVLEHWQDCYEHVYIESIVGDLADLVGHPILLASKETNHNPPPKDSSPDESYTWTFFKLATLKGYVDIRFFGSSNGYYGESADLSLVKDFPEAS